MCAFTAGDGSRFTNHSAMRDQDRKLAARKPAAKPAMGGEGEPEYGAEPTEGSDGAALAQEHGPAAQIDIAHDHAAGTHTVHVMHPDGHSHESQHGSAGEAHKFAADCAGGGEEPGEGM
jgi:hypothetical protein